MAKQSRKSFALLILAAVILSMMSSCRREFENLISSDEGYYLINPDTILETLSRGLWDVFIPLAATPEATSLAPSRLVQWSQTDYLRIARALHEFVWKEPLEDWKLNIMLFRLDCAEANSGPQRAYFTFLKIINVRDQESRAMLDIWIEPFKNTVSWHEITYSPNLRRKRLIDLAQVKIPAETALQIAEQNGGYGVRTAVENACVIFLTLAPGSVYDGWQVEYSGEGPSNLFTIHIDPSTGEYEIVNSKKK